MCICVKRICPKIRNMKWSYVMNTAITLLHSVYCLNSESFEWTCLGPGLHQISLSRATFSFFLLLPSVHHLSLCELLIREKFQQVTETRQNLIQPWNTDIFGITAVCEGGAVINSRRVIQFSFITCSSFINCLLTCCVTENTPSLSRSLPLSLARSLPPSLHSLCLESFTLHQQFCTVGSHLHFLIWGWRVG